MTWTEIKNEIKISLSTRRLSDPGIRLNALDKLEDIFKKNFPEYIKNPKEMFGKIDKNDFKEEVAKFKPNQKLNSAESSVINEIYYRI